MNFGKILFFVSFWFMVVATTFILLYTDEMRTLVKFGTLPMSKWSSFALAVACATMLVLPLLVFFF